MSARLTAEFVGTFLLVFTVGCNILSHTPVWAGVSIACVLMVAIYSLGAISGANFNPAVTVSIAISTAMKGPGDMPWSTCGKYVGVQILGGVVASYTYAILFWDAFYLGPTKGFDGWSAGLCEFLYTFMLCFVVLNVAVSAKNGCASGNDFFGLAIGFVIIAGAYGAGVVSGGCFNPAVAIGIDASSSGFFGMAWCYLYTVWEILGAALAAVLFKVVRPTEFSGISDQSHLRSALISEFLGTYFLVLTVGLNILGNSPAGAFSIAASLTCMIYALGDVSGAHFNPAVTLAILLSSFKPIGFDGRKASLYMLVQILGGIAASLTYALIYRGRTFPLGPLPGFGWSDVACAEIVFTFVLCFVVLSTAVATAATSKSSTMFGLAIGSCVTVGGFAIGTISGGSLNPAVSFGISTSHFLLEGHADWKAFLYTFFEFIGAAAAVGITQLTHAPQEKAARQYDNSPLLIGQK